jgi:hypothetical protein
MGYTTKFDGQFFLDPMPPGATILRLQELDYADRRNFPGEGMPDGYNQWQLTTDGQHVAWDGNEKFYYYVEWLQWLIDHVLAPAGVTVTGTVAYQGEEAADSGTLTVRDGKVHQQKHVLVPAHTLDELRDFQRFVLASDDGDALLRAWQREHRRQPR